MRSMLIAVNVFYCISHGLCQWERAIYGPPPPQLCDTSTDFYETFKYITNSRTRPRVQNFRGYVDAGDLGK